MSLHRIGAGGDTKCQNPNSSFENRWTKTYLNLSDIKVKTFLKKTISVLIIHLHLLGDTLDKSSEWFNPNSFSEMCTPEIILVNSHLVILYVYYKINYIPWILLNYFYLWLKFLHLVTGWFDRIKFQWNAFKRVISQTLSHEEVS